MAIDWTKVIITADDDTVAMAAGQVLLLASGVPGESASVEVVETVTLDPLEDAYVENLGDNRNVRLKFGIPRGDSGVWGGIGGTLEDQADLKQALDAKADIIHTSASGSLVHITDGAAYPVDSLSVSIDPVQDLHGYDNPWPAGGGINVMPKLTAGVYTENGLTVTVSDDGNCKITGSNIDTSIATNVIIPFDNTYTLKAGTYYWHNRNDTINPGIVFDCLGSTQGLNPVNRIASDVLAQDVSKDSCKFYFAKTTFTNLNITCRPSIELTDTVTSWTPYSNICPISGHSSATVTRTGKNLNPVNEFTSTSNDRYISTDGILLKKANTYIFSGVVNTEQSDKRVALFLLSSKTITQGSGDPSSYQQRIFIVPSNNVRFSQTIAPTVDGYLFVKVVSSSVEVTEIQLELGSSATAYESPHVQTVTIALGSTYYGGTLDAVAGTLTVTHKKQRLLSTMAWLGNSGWSTYCYYTKVNDIKLVSGYGSVTELICTHLKKDTPANLALTSGYHIGVGQGDGNSIFINFGQFATADDLKAFLADNEVYIVYPLATPVTITGLTPETISLLLGENNVWTDTGDTSIGYRADTKLYIDSKLAAAIAELQALILEH